MDPLPKHLLGILPPGFEMLSGANPSVGYVPGHSLSDGDTTEVIRNNTMTCGSCCCGTKRCHHSEEPHHKKSKKSPLT
jgi:hypothetical protein